MEWTLDWRTGVWSTGFPFVVREFSFVVTELGPVQTPLHSCAEPNTFKFDFGATADSDGVLNSSNQIIYMWR